MNDHESNVSTSPQRQLRPGLKLLFISLVVSCVSVAVFCYALGLSITDVAGDAGEVEKQAEVKRIPLAIALIGFGLATLSFWSGYAQYVRSRRSDSRR